MSDEQGAVFPQATKTTVTASFNRQIQPKQYETAAAGLIMVKEFDSDLSLAQTDLVTADMITQLKQQVFAQLGIKAEVNDEGILVEIGRVFPGTKHSNGEVPADDEDEEEEERPRQSRTNRGGSSSRGGSSRGGSGRLSKEEAEQLWKDFMGRKANDFYDNLQDDEPNIKHKKSGQKLYLKYAPSWVKDELDD